MEAGHSSSQGYLSQFHGHYLTQSSSMITTETPAVVPVGPIVQNLTTADSSYDSVTHTQVSASNGMPPSQEVLPVRCLHCRKIFSSQFLLDNHACKKATSHKCNLCSKTFTRRYNMKIHVQKHFGNFPHRCIICGNGFTKRNALSKHMLQHGVKRTAKLRPQCDICFRVFTRKYTLRLHRAKHMENGQWKCPFCSAVFWNNVTLKAHVNIHASEDGSQTQPMASYISDGAKMIPGEEKLVPSVADNEQRDMASSSALTDAEQSITLTVRSSSDSDDCKDGIGFIEIKDSESNPGSNLSSMASEMGDSKLLERGGGENFSENIEGAHQKVKEEPGRLNADENTQGGSGSEIIQNLSENTCMSTRRGVSTLQGKDNSGLFNLPNYNKADLLLRKTSSGIRDHSLEESSTARTLTPRTEPQVSESKPFVVQDKNLSETVKTKHNHKPRNNGHSPEVISSSLESVSCTQSMGTPPLQTHTYSREPVGVLASHHLAQSHPDTPTTTAPSISPVSRAESVHSSRSSHSSEVARPSWRCTHCRISFEDSLLYVIHMGCHSHSNPFACNMCGHVSANRVAFMLHFVQGQH